MDHLGLANCRKSKITESVLGVFSTKLKSIFEYETVLTNDSYTEETYNPISSEHRLWPEGFGRCYSGA